ncbi:MAG: 3-dehydroquinate synthase [Hyphomicrobiaceae bacterium]|nr:3-dehydroquinate synthase [Hyphomicrobiaceae bacterium]
MTVAGEMDDGGRGKPFESVGVELAERRYEVLIGSGLLAAAPQLIADRLGPARCGIVTDENVARLHLRGLEAGLAALGRHAGTIVLAPGEATKSLERLGEVSDGLIAMGLERNDLVIALGGGVIGDLAGFAASIVRRGMRFVQIPTTLLAQVDSSVGGKTAVNSRHGKNLIGAFHQPSLVIADTDALSTLPAREMRAGYAEVVKYGLLGDRAFYDWLHVHRPSLFGNDPSILAEAVRRSVAAKAAIVARDETETGDRMLLNLGHTFGHALEAWAGYSDRLLHGEAVAIGMAQAFRFSEQMGLAPSGTAEIVARHLAAAGLPTRVGQIPGSARPTAAELLRLMAQDKKVRAGRLTFILVRGIGDAFISREVDAATLTTFLEQETSG